jgi:hypothetical protein
MACQVPSRFIATSSSFPSFPSSFHPALSSNSTQYMLTALEIIRLSSIFGLFRSVSDRWVCSYRACCDCRLFHVKVQRKRDIWESCSRWSLTLLSTTPRWLTTCALSLLLVSSLWWLRMVVYGCRTLFATTGCGWNLGEGQKERRKQ